MSNLDRLPYERLTISDTPKVERRKIIGYPSSASLTMAEGLYRGDRRAFAVSVLQNLSLVNPPGDRERTATGLRDRLWMGANGGLMSDEFDLFNTLEPQKRTELREKLRPHLTERLEFLIGSLEASGQEFYYAATYGGQHHDFYGYEGQMYPELPESAGIPYTIAPKLKTFSLTDHNYTTPLHIEPVVESHDGQRVGFLPLGAIPLIDPLFRSIENGQQ